MSEKEAIVETITALICGTAVVVLMIWFFVMVHRSNNCESYEHLTGIRTTMLNWKCHKYVDGQLQIVKELE
jgi:hypothetical protein